MIVVKKGYYFLDEVYNYCSKQKKKYMYFNQILQSLKSYGEKYVSSNFFHDELKDIENELTDLTDYFSIKYFNFYNSHQEKKLLEYFDYKIPKYCNNSLKAIHLYNEKVVEALKEGYVINILGFYTSFKNLKDAGIMILDYSKILCLENKDPKNRKKLFIGAWK